jgi:hypothetical protein
LRVPWASHQRWRYSRSRVFPWTAGTVRTAVVAGEDDDEHAAAVERVEGVAPAVDAGEVEVGGGVADAEGECHGGSG